MIPADSLQDTIRAAVHSSAYSMTLADATRPDLPLSYVNPAFENLTGYSFDEAVGRNCRFLQGPETDKKAVRRIAQAITQESSTSTMLLNYRKDGTKFWNRFQLSPVRNGAGNVIAYLGVQLDATYDVAAEKMERERQKLETLGRLAGGVAHELNNALQPVRLMSDLLGDYIGDLPDQDRKDARNCIDTINSHVMYAHSIVSEILNFSKPASRSTRPYQVSEVLNEAVYFAEGFLPVGVRLDYGLPGSRLDLLKNATVSVDLTGLKQILVNLFTNASYAMNGAGSIDIDTEVETLKGEQSRILSLVPGDYVRISVSDTGCGISAEDLPHIFDPFFTKKPASQGTGLGLAMVQGTLTSWNGSIAVSSADGAGTTFDVYLPVTFNGGQIDRDTTH